MARPRKGSTRRPNTTAIRIRPDLKPIINLIYRKIVGSDNTGMPIGDKVETILKAAIKKVEALEWQVLDLKEALDIERTIKAIKVSQ